MSPARLAATLATFFLWALAWATFANAQKPPKLTYTVTLKGVANKALAKQVRSVMVLISKRSKPPSTLIGLEQRAATDRKTIRDLLRSEGYYGSSIKVAIPESGAPVKIVVTVTPGPAYRLTRFTLRWAAGDHPNFRPADLGVTINARARAAAILSAQEKLFAKLADGGWPFARIKERRVEVHHRLREVRVRFTINQRRRIRFGRTIIEGAKGVDRGYIRRRIVWRQGGRFTTDPVRRTRERLAAADVFGRITIAPDESRIGPDGRTPMIIRLTERKPRSIAVTGFFDTSLGPGAEVEWRHRNLFGGVEQLVVKAGGTLTEYGARISFRKPDIFQGNEDLLADARYLELNTPAYDGREAVAGIALEWRVSPQLTLTAGPVVDFARLDQDGTTRRFTLGGALLTGRYDGSDSLLNPTKGYRLSLTVAPYTGSSVRFARMLARVSGYVPIQPDSRLVLAFWSRMGIVIGEDNPDLPANKRLFAGGGGSIRGFGYQRVGPLDSANNPTGGRSLFSFGLELRYRITETWGAVAFFEGGNVSTGLFPNGRYLYGVGAGIRYNSPAGVIRLDLATPISRRTGDSLIQIYVSIGQAF